MTIVELWDAFRMERSISLAETTIDGDYRQVEKWLRRCPIQEPELGRQILIWVLQQKPEKSARRVGYYLKTLYRWASTEDVGLVQRNPISSFKFPKKPQKAAEVTVIPQELVKDVLSALEQGSTRQAQWHLLANFMLQTGVRTGEAFGLAWDDVSWESKRMRIHRNMTATHGLRPRTKTGQERWVPLNPVALRVLEDMHSITGEQNFVFPWNRGSFMWAFSNAMRRLVEGGLTNKRFRPYDLRHTHISALLERGIPVTQVSSWAGNSPAMVWDHYAATTNTYEMPTL